MAFWKTSQENSQDIYLKCNIKKNKTQHKARSDPSLKDRLIFGLGLIAQDQVWRRLSVEGVAVLGLLRSCPVAEGPVWNVGAAFVPQTETRSKI